MTKQKKHKLTSKPRFSAKNVSAHFDSPDSKEIERYDRFRRELNHLEDFLLDMAMDLEDMARKESDKKNKHAFLGIASQLLREWKSLQAEREIFNRKAD